MLKSPIVVIGIGEIGSVLARGFLRVGYPVYPVTRELNMAEVASEIQNPEAVIVAVGESELDDVLAKIPPNWRSRLILIQNELLPNDWQKHDLQPTVISVWFEKKKGQDVKVVVASPIYGDKADLLSSALDALDIPNVIIIDKDQMTFELVRKNYYILTSNIAGLRVGGTVGELWDKHQGFAEDVISDINAIQEHLVSSNQPSDTELDTGLKSSLDRDALTAVMLKAFEGDPEHGCMGRSAPARLKRAIEIADSAGIEVNTLKDIQANDV